MRCVAARNSHATSGGSAARKPCKLTAWNDLRRSLAALSPIHTTRQLLVNSYERMTSRPASDASGLRKSQVTKGGRSPHDSPAIRHKAGTWQTPQVPSPSAACRGWCAIACCRGLWVIGREHCKRRPRTEDVQLDSSQGPDD